MSDYKHGDSNSNPELDKECTWCGQDDPECEFVWRQPYDFEPGSWCCVQCWEDQPWKH